MTWRSRAVCPDSITARSRMVFSASASKAFTATMQSWTIAKSGCNYRSSIVGVDTTGARAVAAFASVSKVSPGRPATLPIGCPSKVA